MELCLKACKVLHRNPLRGVFFFFSPDPPVNTSVRITSSGQITEGMSVTLSCTSFTASSLTTFTWFHKNGTDMLRGTGETLIIESLSATDGGTYTCVAQNSWGSQNATFVLTVQKGEYRAGFSPDTSLRFLLLYVLYVRKELNASCQRDTV